MSFDALGEYFSSHRNLPLFLLFFTGFAIKAGFIPAPYMAPGGASGSTVTCIRGDVRSDDQDGHLRDPEGTRCDAV